MKTKELLEGIYDSKGFRVVVFDFKELIVQYLSDIVIFFSYLN